jgi:hypothetical protein
MNGKPKVVLAGVMAFSLLVVITASNATAGLIFKVEEVTANPGDTVSVGVFASSDNAQTGDVLTGFSLPVEVGAVTTGVTATPGNGMPAGLSYNANPIQNEIANFDPTALNTALDLVVSPTGGGTGIDGIANGSGPDLSLTTIPVKLFDFVIDVPLAAPGSIISVELVNTTPIDQLSAADDAGPAIIAEVLAGSIEIVPEPATAITCLSGLLFGLASFRKLK